MFESLFLKGGLIGFSVAAPVGPIGLLCIRNSLTYGMRCGLASGLGAAFADALFAGIAAFGVAALGDFLEIYRGVLQLVGGSFLIYLGAKTMASPPPAALLPDQQTRNLSECFLTTFFLTLTNPMTILSFGAIYAAAGLAEVHEEWRAASLTTLGVLAGSAIWWMFLSLFASRFKHRMSPGASRWMNRISGGVICGFGLVAVVVGFFT